MLLLFFGRLLTHSGSFRARAPAGSVNITALLAKLPLYIAAVAAGFLLFAVAVVLLNK